MNGKPPCKYGRSCYRLNPDHFDSFSHPDGHKMAEKHKNEEDDDDAPSVKAKKSKLSDVKNNDFNLYFTKVDGIDEKWNVSSLALSIKDILALDADLLESSVQFNYMIDIPWLMSNYPKSNRTKPLLIVTGKIEPEMRAEAHEFKTISLASARLEIAYGTHHTKMMLLKYKRGLRVVVHTANLIEDDWHQKTQGIWLSPLFPRNPDDEASADASSSEKSESSTTFQSDLIDYLKSYRLKPLDLIAADLVNYDFSSANVFLVGSTPGRHTGSNLNKWGHLRLKNLLKTYNENKELDKTWPVICQFSSIGSLGASAENWLSSEFRASLSASGSSSLTTAPHMHLIFPSVENVRTSLEGYSAGGSLPYSINTAKKQPYLKKYLHQWKSDTYGRTRASPHIKSYVRCDAFCKNAAWFLISSANLSKAAWGAMEKNNSQLMVRSYELGVLFLPQFFKLDNFDLDDALSVQDRFPVPFDLPLTSYASSAEPWIVDIPYKNKADTHGKYWP